MKIMKRNGTEVTFDSSKIYRAIEKANQCVDPVYQMNEAKIHAVTENVTKKIQSMEHTVHVEEIQDMVETAIMEMRGYEVAQKYVRYRFQRELARKANTTDDAILSLLDLSNEEIRQENANKNPTINSTQRDYMAGEVSKDLARRVLLPADVWEAHSEGIIHFHDADYFAQKEHNCQLVNLEDMLQNGTVISGTLIEKPHSFYTACNITTQIVAQIASNQYGGQTFTLSHLSPFVEVSRQKIRKQLLEENAACGITEDEAHLSKRTELRLKDEIKRGIQTIQYQLITLMTCNGQAPFVSVFMYLDEVPDGQERKDLAMIIEEVLNQRIQGVKNEQGVWVTPAFPKLLYVLDEDNVYPGSPYYYLTELAAKCTAKRMVPDYISAKVMKRLKNGEVYPCMGCVDGKEVISYRLFGKTYTESFERAWNRLRNYYEVQLQPNGTDVYMKTTGMEIYDQKNGWVENYGMIRNNSENWVRISFSNGRVLTCTDDHPFMTENRGMVLAKDLTSQDEIQADFNTPVIEDAEQSMLTDRAWLYGFLLCDSSYYSHVTASIAAKGEDDIADNFKRVISKEFELAVDVDEKHRGQKGDYKDLKIRANKHTLIDLKNMLIKWFEGTAKNDRHIPNEAFRWTKEARLAFLAGMIDADGYINDTQSITNIQIGATNKELALQQVLLAQSLGMPAYVYLNHYSSRRKEKIRYRVEFTPTEELINCIVSKKKRERPVNIVRTNKSVRATNRIHITKIELLDRKAYSYDVTTASECFTVSGMYSHNCRSFLTVEDSQKKEDGTRKFYGRFNQGVVTINLVETACASGGDFDKFWQILDETLELCHKALRCRHERLLGTVSDVAPILWQHGSLARLKKGETIDKLLYDGYSTISLGYAGLYEMCVRMTGKSHTAPEAKPFALSVMKKLNDKCKEWRKAENIAYSVYGTPMESTTYKFAKALQRRWGIIPDVTDHNYITNSYHVNVRENIDAFAKLGFEAAFQELSPGGAISYVEVPDMTRNLPAVLSVIQYIYETIMYAELNTRSDYCQVCGFEGEIRIVTDEHGKLVWECPNCKNRDHDRMNVPRRVCGYIGENDFNQGRMGDVHDRVFHL